MFYMHAFVAWCRMRLRLATYLMSVFIYLFLIYFFTLQDSELLTLARSLTFFATCTGDLVSLN